MMSFFKSFGQGILYLLTLPVVLVILALYAAMGILIILFLMLKSVILFFKGKNIFNDFPEDVKVNEILKPKSKDTEVEVVEPERDPTSSVYTQTFFQSHDTSYPTYEDKEVETIDTTEPELIEEPETHEIESSLFEEEPDIIDRTSAGRDDTDLEHFDIGTKRIIEDKKD